MLYKNSEFLKNIVGKSALAYFKPVLQYLKSGYFSLE